MQRIHITGGPGTGKTTFARTLGGELGLQVLELDGQALDIAAKAGGAIDFDSLAAARLAQNQLYASRDSWISEGSNCLVAGPLLERADVIVALYSPWRVASYRILTRHFKANLAGNNRFPGIANLYRFWRWSALYYRNQHPAGFNEYGTPRTQTTLEEVLAAYEYKVMRCRTKPEIHRALETLVREHRSNESLSDR